MALIDLHFAEDTVSKSYDCEVCKRNPSIAKKRKCEEPYYEDYQKPLPKALSVGKQGQKYFFCPGKARQHPEIEDIFSVCRMSMETGILPSEGFLEDQNELFVEVFPIFVHYWKDRSYLKVWDDVHEFVDRVLKAIFGKKGS